MRAFKVTISETRERRMEVAAQDMQQAKLAVQSLLGASETVKAVEQIGQARHGEAGAALAHLLGQDFLALDGAAASIGDWLAAAVAGSDETRRSLNARLAMAGLRVIDGPQIAVASAGSIPTLAMWFAGTEWQGPDLISTLRTAPEAQVRVYSFAGINSKAVVLPAELVLSGGEQP